MTDSGDSQSACQDATKGAVELLQAERPRPKDLKSLAMRGYTAKPVRSSSQEKVGILHPCCDMAISEILSDCVGICPVQAAALWAGMQMKVMQDPPCMNICLNCALPAVHLCHDMCSRLKLLPVTTHIPEADGSPS